MMTFDSIKNSDHKIINTDVLVIGGGMAGCCAAARAADLGVNVTLVEKADTRRSGCAGMGIDHYESVPNDGVTAEALATDYVRQMTLLNGGGRFGNPNIMYKYFTKQWDTIHSLEGLGVPMKSYNGEYYLFNRPDRFPLKRHWLRVHWQMIKPILSKAIYDRGVNVVERTMVLDLLKKDGKVVGCTTMNTRTGEFMVVKAKATVMATGQFQRAYNGEEPMSGSYKLRYDGAPSAQSGDGYAMGYRSGADLVNMDANGHGFRCRDDLALSVGNFEHNDGIPSSHFTWDGKEFQALDGPIYRKMEEEGSSPVYRCLEHLPEDYRKRVELCLVDEKTVDFKFSQDRRFNPFSHAFEVIAFKPISFMAATGIHIDENFGSRVPGLFAIGDCASPLHSCSFAASSAFMIGDYLPDYIKGVSDPDIDESQVAESKEVAYAPLKSRNADIEPLDLECAVRYVCEHYVGLLRSEGKLREGRNRLDSLKRLVLPRVEAEDPHELTKYNEVRNILDLAQVHVEASLVRKESRGNFMRVDYPEMDPALTSKLTHQRMENGKAVVEHIAVPELDPEIMKEVK